jgi:FkbM family methyltransferase
MALRHNISREDVESVRSKRSYHKTFNNYGVLSCLDSFNLWVDKRDESLTPCLFSDGYWESWITSWFTYNVLPGDTVIDIGAHCGYYTMMFEKLSQAGRVISFEPNPNYAGLLEMTKKENHAKFEVRQLALSNHSGGADLVYPGNLTGGASIQFVDYPNEQATGIRVNTSTLDDELDGLYPNVIKIDAEGAEEKIWWGGQKVIKSRRPPLVVLEYTPGAYSKEFTEDLFATGRVYKIDYNGMQVTVTKTWLEDQKDWVMLVISSD